MQYELFDIIAARRHKKLRENINILPKCGDKLTFLVRDAEVSP
jgi:hypothetical protein